MFPFRNQSFLMRLRRFFAYRYGLDALYVFLVFVCLALHIAGRIWDFWPVQLLALAILFYAVWRAMSFKIGSRRRENERFKAIFRPFTRLFTRIRYRKTHVFRRCPSCRNTLRLPRVKGAHTVRCPRCNNRFDTKVR
ncbi:MAG: hypothetical protein J6W28_03650 [Clostridia bacterium]|nr:hypothetical protein [Clostridia bacterium]